MNGPDEELHHPLRQDLINKLHEALDRPIIDSAAKALLWFSDIEQLRGLIEDTLNKRTREGLVTALASKGHARALKTWATRTRLRSNILGKRRVCDSPDDAEEASSAQRQAGPKTATLERDGETCVVTKTGFLPEVAHIYPFSLGRRDDRDSRQLKSTLRMFWSEEDTTAWETSISGKNGTESPRNMMVLCTHVHKAWGKGAFAIKPLGPISPDGKRLQAQFYWLQVNEYAADDTMVSRPSFSGNLATGPKNFLLHDCQTGQQIVSGHPIVFETDDPDQRPLPSLELLNMQWMLQRVLAMSGAGEANDEDLDPDLGFGASAMIQEEDEVWSSDEEGAASSGEEGQEEGVLAEAGLPRVRQTVESPRWPQQQPIRPTGENAPPSPSKAQRDRETDTELALRSRVNY